MSVPAYDQENVTVFWDFGQSMFNVSYVVVHPEFRLIYTADRIYSNLQHKHQHPDPRSREEPAQCSPSIWAGSIVSGVLEFFWSEHLRTAIVTIVFGGYFD